jgi:hypothetical protein
MNRILLAAASTVLLAGRIHSSDEPRFAVEEKTTLAKSFERHMKLESKAFRIFVAGQDEPIHPPGDLHIALEDTGRIDVTDEYLSMGKGRPSKLKRTYDKIEENEKQRASSGEGGADDSEDHEKKEESALEGRTVFFTWSDESGAFVASFPKDGGDAELLDDLNEDMDLRFLLPKGKVAADESWDLDAKEFGSVLAPGGDLKLKDKDKDAEENADQSIGKEIRKHLEGKAHATWKGVREEGGKKVGIIALAADLASEGDVESKGEMEGKTHFKLKLDLEGELAWDLAGGHFHSFQVGGKVQLDTAATATIKMGDKSAEMRQELDLEGETSYKASLR